MLLLAIPVLGAILFIPAGTLHYWEAWLYMAVLLIPMAFALRHMLRHHGEILDRRLRLREKEAAQRRIIAASYPFFLLAFILPGLDHRWGWSDVPPVVVIAADAVVLVGYALCVRVMLANPYAGRTVQVDADQQVVSTGPYAIVRHPMYLGAMLLYVASPLALGSYWAVLPALVVIPILVARIINEEQVLERDLPGYREYKAVTRYCLLPGIW